jgi:hypothetical protein
MKHALSIKGRNVVPPTTVSTGEQLRGGTVTAISAAQTVFTNVVETLQPTILRGLHFKRLDVMSGRQVYAASKHLLLTVSRKWLKFVEIRRWSVLSQPVKPKYELQTIVLFFYPRFHRAVRYH